MNSIVSSKISDKRDGFNIEIVYFPFLDGDVPHSLPMVYIYLKPKVTLHFELPNISLLLLILTKLNIAMSCWGPP